MSSGRVRAFEVEPIPAGLKALVEAGATVTAFSRIWGISGNVSTRRKLKGAQTISVGELVQLATFLKVQPQDLFDPELVKRVDLVPLLDPLRDPRLKELRWTERQQRLNAKMAAARRIGRGLPPKVDASQDALFDRRAPSATASAACEVSRAR
jgi:hypothetical protein